MCEYKNFGGLHNGKVHLQRAGNLYFNILEAINLAGNKVGDGFDLSRLFPDAQRLLNHSESLH